MQSLTTAGAPHWDLISPSSCLSGITWRNRNVYRIYNVVGTIICPVIALLWLMWLADITPFRPQCAFILLLTELVMCLLWLWGRMLSGAKGLGTHRCPADTGCWNNPLWITAECRSLFGLALLCAGPGSTVSVRVFNPSTGSGIGLAMLINSFSLTGWIWKMLPMVEKGQWRCVSVKSSDLPVLRPRESLISP